MEPRAFFSRGQQENAVFQLAQDDRVHDQVGIVPSQPIDNAALGRRLCGFAQHIGIDQVCRSLRAWTITDVPR